MTALVAVGTFVPETVVPIESMADEFGLTPMQMKVFRRYHKLGEVRLAPDCSQVDLLRRAVADLAALRGAEHRVRYAIFARTFPVVAPFGRNPLRELCDGIGLEHAEAFSVSHHACSSGLLAIDLAGRLLAADGDPDALALVVAGEKAFTMETRHILETSFFGEGAAACLIAADGTRDRLLSYAANLRGEFDAFEHGALALDFQEAYHDSLAEAILAAVTHAGLTLDDIRLILPHNVNVIAWSRACRRLPYPLDRVLLDHVATYGHQFCADAFVNYRTATDRGLLQPGDHYVVAAAGAGRGATFSAMVFQH